MAAWPLLGTPPFFKEYLILKVLKNKMDLNVTFVRFFKRILLKDFHIFMIFTGLARVAFVDLIPSDAFR